MRAHVLREYLGQQDLALAVRVLAEIRTRGRHGGPPFDLAMLALAAVLGQELLEYDLLARLYSEAKQAELDELLPLFLSSRKVEAAVPLSSTRRDQTLGFRKWQARDTRRRVLERIIRSPEAPVMENLLRNPHLTEKDVITMASRRPIDPAILVQVAQSPRWIARYAIKRTLLLNPCTPTEVSLRLLAFMTRGDTHLISTLSNLPDVVQAAAAAQLRRGRRGRENV